MVNSERHSGDQTLDTWFGCPGARVVGKEQEKPEPTRGEEENHKEKKWLGIQKSEGGTREEYIKSRGIS